MYLKLAKCSRGVLGFLKRGSKSATFISKVPGSKGWRTKNARISVFGLAALRWLAYCPQKPTVFGLTALRWLADVVSAYPWSIFGKRDPSNASKCEAYKELEGRIPSKPPLFALFHLRS